MMKYLIIYLSTVIVSCNLSHKHELKFVNSKSKSSKVEKDTVISYEIKGISGEGTETKVNYVNCKITKSITSIYGETGQAIIVYDFEMDKIKVCEFKYSYKVGIENVKSNKDMHLDYKTDYIIDFNGNLLGQKIPDRIDIFKEFKETVPFELK